MHNKGRCTEALRDSREFAVSVLGEGMKVFVGRTDKGSSKGHVDQPFLQPREVGRAFTFECGKSMTKHMLGEFLQLILGHLSKS